MNKILVTGATGNIGAELISSLTGLNNGHQIIAAVRNVKSASKLFTAMPTLEFRQFDFENQSTFKPAFEGVGILFLLRPPQISDVEKVFRPLLEAAKAHGIQKVVFLSVQGAEKSKVIPHNKIEGLIKSLNFSYIFVRPSYFMQNLTTTLLPEIVSNQSITLPAGKGVFNWVDVNDITEASAVLISNFDNHQNKAFEITGTENRNFGDVVDMMSVITGKAFTYNSINPISFYFKKRKEGLTSGFALVLTILHFLPRIQGAPKISNNFKMLTGKEPTTLKAFIEREQEMFLGPSRIKQT